MRLSVSNRDYEQISAYLDGQLPSGEQNRFEERLRKQPELKEALNEMSRTRMLLRQAPRRRAPRNFTLTPAMVADIQPRRKRGFSLNLFPALSFASALAAFALVATLLFQLLPGQPAGTGTEASRAAQPAAPALATTAAAAPAAAAPNAAAPSTQGLTAPQAAAGKAAADQSAPPVIVWSGPGYGGGAATGMGGGAGGDATSHYPYLGPLLGPPSFQNAAPAYGMGGGGGGGGGGVTGPAVVLPPQAAGGLPSAAPTLSAAPTQAAAAAPITGNGPILGVPAKDQGGQVLDEKSIRGFPSGPTGLQPPTASAAPDTSTPAVSNTAETTLFGLSRLTLIEILLGAIAVLTGAAALILRRIGNR